MTNLSHYKRSTESVRFLVVNADDVGLCPGVNRGTLDAVHAGTVTSISVFVGPDFHVDFRPYTEAGVSVGLHLNLTLGEPCTPFQEIPSLVDRAGRFIHDRETLFSRVKWADAEREMSSQIDLFRTLAGRNPSHLDTHKHLHALNPGLFHVVSRLARELNVPLRARDDEGRDDCRRAGVRSTDCFLGDVRPAPYWTVRRLEEQLAQVPVGTTELMCHLGIDMEEIPGLWYLHERETETETFCSERAKFILSALALTGRRGSCRRDG